MICSSSSPTPRRRREFPVHGSVRSTPRFHFLFRRGGFLSSLGLWAAITVVSLGVSWGAPWAIGAGAAQEAIFDPELEAAGTSSQLDGSEAFGAESTAGDTGQIIDDPELASVPEASQAAVEALPSEFRAVLHSRLGRDFVADSEREELWEVQNLIQIEAKLRLDPDTRVALGLRMRHWANSMGSSTEDAGAFRNELDLLPVAAYYDRTLAAGWHLRLGFQDLPIGRFDVLSGTDVLSVKDLRDGAATLPDASRVAQLAARLDVDLTDSIGFEVMWVPFFSPHLVQVWEGDYSVRSGFEDELDPVAAEVSEGLFGSGPSPEEQAAQDLALAELSRTARERGAAAGLDVFTPDPDLSASQLVLRGVWHGELGELAATLGTALEKLPALRFSERPAVQGSNGEDIAAYVEGSIEYPRYYLMALDGALDVGPVQLGAEISLGLGRAFYFTDGIARFTEGGVEEAQPSYFFFQGEFAQLSLRGEYLADPAWIVAVEANVGTVLAVPDNAPHGLQGLHGGRSQFGAVGMVRYTGADFGGELGLGLLTGTTYLAAPRLFYIWSEGVHIEMGAQIFGQIADSVVGQSLGSAYEGVDQFFLGLRWGPAL